jgi:L-serine/L-threonine ammonia-lyase
MANSTSFSSLRLHSLLWTGHSTVIDEIVDFFEQTTVQQQPNNRRIGAVLASVGGGGLLCGILEGLERNYHSSNKIRSDMVRGSKVFACETEGAASFAASFNSPDGSIVCLDGINSIATSLGATSVTPAVIQRSQRHRDRGEINSSGEDVFSYVCTDSEAVQGCVQFSSDHRMLVGKSFKVLIVSSLLLKNSQYCAEPACGASLAPLYSARLREKLLEELKDDENSAIVVEVCGGSGVNLDLMRGWKESYLDN